MILAVFVQPLKRISYWKCFHNCGRLEVSSLAYRDCNFCAGRTANQWLSWIESTFYLYRIDFDDASKRLQFVSKRLCMTELLGQWAGLLKRFLWRTVIYDGRWEDGFGYSNDPLHFLFLLVRCNRQKLHIYITSCRYILTTLHHFLLSPARYSSLNFGCLLRSLNHMGREVTSVSLKDYMVFLMTSKSKNYAMNYC